MVRSNPSPDFTALVRDHHRAVYSTALRVTRSESDAQDVVQEVYLAVLEGRLDPGARGKPEASLRFAAVRAALNTLRKARHRRAREDRMAENPSPEPNSADREVEHREARGALRLRVDALPEDLRHAVILRFEEGLTYASIARASSCSEPTAHGRVQRALDRLRTEMGQAGFAGLAPLLPELLGEAPRATLPAGLEAGLLSLQPAVAKAGFASPWVISGLMTVFAAGALAGIASLGDGELEDPAPRVVVELADEAEQDEGPRGRRRPLPAPVPPSTGVGETPPRDDLPRPVAIDDFDRYFRERAAGGVPTEVFPTGFLSGVVVDRHGRGLPGVRVEASSIQRLGKIARFEEHAETDPRGRYRIQVPVALDRGQDYALFCSHQDHVPDRSGPFLAEPDAEETCPEVRLLPNSVDLPGEYLLELSLVDARGLPLAHVPVQVLRRTRTLEGEWVRIPESKGVTNPEGIVNLAGRFLGEKVIRANASSGLASHLRSTPTGNLQAHEESFSITRVGLSTARVEVPDGLTIFGVARSVDGKPIVHESLTLVSTSDNPSWHHTRSDAHGGFEFDGLNPGTYTFRMGMSRWSDPRIEVEAGTRDLDLLLKEATDPRDLGLHGGEFHGSVQDAVSGAEIPMNWDRIRAHRVERADRAWLEREVIPDLLHPRPVQSMMPPEPTPGFHITGLEAGNYILEVRAPGYAPSFAGPFVLGDRDVQRDLRIELHRPVRMVGRVLDPEGQPLEGAIVFLMATGELGPEQLRAADAELRAAPEANWQRYEDARTDARGRFEIANAMTSLPLAIAVLHLDHEPSCSPLGKLEGAEVIETPDLRAGKPR